jgi:hypothetical protein
MVRRRRPLFHDFRHFLFEAEYYTRVVVIAPFLACCFVYFVGEECWQWARDTWFRPAQ